MPSRARSSTRSQNCRRAAGSNPVVGSSRNSSSGRPRMPSATSSRRRWPPESSRVRWVGAVREADRGDDLVRVARRRVVAGEVPRPSRRTVSSERSVTDCSTMPTRARHCGVASAGSTPEHADLAGVAAAVALQDLHRRGLAGAVGPEQREHLAAGDLEVHAVDRRTLAVALQQAADDTAVPRGSQARACRIEGGRGVRERSGRGPAATCGRRRAPVAARRLPAPVPRTGRRLRRLPADRGRGAGADVRRHRARRSGSGCSASPRSCRSWCSACTAARCPTRSTAGRCWSSASLVSWVATGGLLLQALLGPGRPLGAARAGGPPVRRRSRCRRRRAGRSCRGCSRSSWCRRATR